LMGRPVSLRGLVRRSAQRDAEVREGGRLTSI
jgi:hypothetical protein